jgi:hypothetical protein
MKKRTAPGVVYGNDFSQVNARSNPLLDPVRGDVLPDSACERTSPSWADIKRAHEARLAQLKQLHDSLP